MTAADTDVRAGRPGPTASPRGAGSLRLARLLLHSFQNVARKLDRKAVLLLSLAASLMPACIIPVGPEWEDPVGVPNAPPHVFDPDPPWDEVAVGSQNSPRTFSFRVSDVNAMDTLTMRVISDGGQVDEKIVNQGPVSFEIACFKVDATLTRHIILAAVADKPFTTAGPLEVQDNRTPSVVSWLLEMTCPSPQ